MGVENASSCSGLAAAAKLQARLAQLGFKGKHRPKLAKASGVLGNTGSKVQGN
tara:strand:- start:333 stop:491 length:159 start_codon:yes stop_codon:yes gene_type:complete